MMIEVTWVLALQYLLNPSDGLIDAMRVFYQGKSDIIIPVLPETYAGRNSHFCLFNKHLGKFYGAHLYILFRDFCPYKHGPFRFFNGPADSVQAVNE